MTDKPQPFKLSPHQREWFEAVMKAAESDKSVRIIINKARTSWGYNGSCFCPICSYISQEYLAIKDQNAKQ